MKKALIISWTVISSIGTILGMIGYFRQYPIQFDIIMNSNHILIAFGIFCLISLFVIWTIWIIQKINETIKSINSSLYNHAQHIMAIRECFKREKEYKELEKEITLIDTQELFGVLHPSKEQTSNNAKNRERLLNNMKKNYPQLFDEKGKLKKQ